MTVDERVSKTLQEKSEFFNSKEGFQELQGFYEELVTRGIIAKQEYSLPLIDTIGQKLYKAHNR